jgi:NAD(P)-dependent dehydrogenase (short-subunit alcohol dehydrogenase family)
MTERAHATLVTGGGGGLGRAVALYLASRGGRLALVDVTRESLESVAAEVGEAGGARAAVVVADLTDPDAVEGAWESAQGTVGPLDGLVNAAGMFKPNDFTELSLDRWQAGLALHLTAPFLLSRCAARAWIHAGVEGAIVNVASTAAIRAKASGSAEYGASKAGLLGLTIDLAVELGPHGIRTNAVLPHSFHSPINAERLRDPVQYALAVESVPLKRIATAEEVAAAVGFLLLDGSYLNGVLLPCDGGMAAQMP